MIEKLSRTSTKKQKKSNRNWGINRHLLKRVLQYSILVIWLLFTLFPVIWTFTSSLKSPGDVFAMPPKWFFDPTLHNYKVVFGLKIPTELEGVTQEMVGAGRSQFPRYLLNTAIIATGATLLSLVLGGMAAYALARSPFRGRRVTLGAILVTQLIPPVVILVPIYVLWRNLHLLHTHIGVILSYLSFTLPFTIWMMYSFFIDLPVELEYAAMIDGCSRLQAITKIVIPLAKPGLLVTGIFTFITAWNEFLYASVLTGTNVRTLTTSILTFITDKAILWGQLYAASSAIMLPVLIITFLVQKYIGRGMTAGALKG
jgi:multiple sugar transport system permease protein